jgi:hypothetical protein
MATCGDSFADFCADFAPILENTVKTLEVSGPMHAAAGFAPARRIDRAITRRARLMVQMIATVGLIFSLAVAATAVSIGIARAQAPAHISVTAVR